MLFFKKNILIPTVAEKNIQILVEEKKINLIQSFCHKIIIRPHLVFTDGQQQRQPNHNTTTYCVY
jgi:hypothetical protein